MLQQRHAFDNILVQRQRISRTILVTNCLKVHFCSMGNARHSNKGFQYILAFSHTHALIAKCKSQITMLNRYPVLKCDGLSKSTLITSLKTSPEVKSELSG